MNIQEIFDKCCQQVALNNKLGKNLVTGHRRTYYNEAVELFAKEIHNNALDLALQNVEITYLGGNSDINDFEIDKQSIEQLKIKI